jgi:hypothetical protein
VTDHAAGLWLRWARGEEQLEELIALIDDFTRYVSQGKSFDLEPEKDASSGVYWYKLRLLERPDYTRWSVFVGEVVHNARSPLDQLVCALAMSNSTNPDGKTSFPVFDDADDYEFGLLDRKGRRNRETSGVRKLDRVDGSVKTFIERLQPYHKHDTGRGLLFLDQLWRIDKHLVPLGAIGDGIPLIGSVVGSGPEPALFRFEPPFPYEDGAHAATTDRPMKMHMQIAVEVKFQSGPPWVSKPVPFAGLPVKSVLKDAVKAARHVISELEPKLTWSPYP